MILQLLPGAWGGPRALCGSVAHRWPWEVQLPQTIVPKTWPYTWLSGVHCLVASMLLVRASHTHRAGAGGSACTDPAGNGPEQRACSPPCLLPEPLLLLGPKGAGGMKTNSGGFLSSTQRAEGRQPLLSEALTLQQHAQSPVDLPGISPHGHANNTN